MDLLPVNVAGELLYRPVLGGSLYTVALGIARLGGESGYLWELSHDDLGRRFLAALQVAGVDCAAVRLSGRATPVALVDMSGEEPRYNIADPDGVMLDTVPGALPAGAVALHIGSAVLARDPVGAAIEAVARTAPLVTIDYNARAPSIVDAVSYRARLRRIAALSGVVKASVADIQLIAEGEPEAYMAELIEAGAAMTVLTAGSAGARIMTAGACAEAPSLAPDVVDPVGAGDSFMAALLYRLQRDRTLSKDALRQYDAAGLADLLEYAQAAAAFTCAHKGAVMPTAGELSRYRQAVCRSEA